MSSSTLFSFTINFQQSNSLLASSNFNNCISLLCFCNDSCSEMSILVVQGAASQLPLLGYIVDVVSPFQLLYAISVIVTVQCLFLLNTKKVLLFVIDRIEINHFKLKMMRAILFFFSKSK